MPVKIEIISDGDGSILAIFVNSEPVSNEVGRIYAGEGLPVDLEKLLVRLLHGERI